MRHHRRGVCDWQCYATVYIGCRLSRQSYPGVIHYSLLLMLFGAAAFKAVHTPLLTTMLVSELASMLCLAGKMQAGNPVLSQFSVSRFPWHQHFLQGSCAIRDLHCCRERADVTQLAVIASDVIPKNAGAQWRGCRLTAHQVVAQSRVWQPAAVPACASLSHCCLSPCAPRDIPCQGVLSLLSLD